MNITKKTTVNSYYNVGSNTLIEPKKEEIAMHRIWKLKESKSNKVILIQD